MKKRHIYGTVMVDIESRNIIDLLDSRDLNDVVKWLKTYPNLKIISRDGSQTYATAIRKAHPNAVQISDRFHLLKNLSDYCKSYITKTMNFKIKIQQPLHSNKSNNINIITRKNMRIRQAQSLYCKGISLSEISLKLKMDIRTVKKYITLNINEPELKEKDVPQINHEENVSKKEKILNTVRNLSNDGYGIREISRETGLSRQTIRKYLNPNTSAVHGTYGVARESLLSPFHNTIDVLITKGYTFKKIEEIIKLNGYTGSASAIRMYSTRKRRLINQIIDSTNNISTCELIDRKHLIKLLYKPIDKVKEISAEMLEEVNKEYPILPQIYELLSSFKEVLFSKVPNKLNGWIENAKSLNLSEINSFINGITRDIEGVKNSIKYGYSNGLAEGSVNKIKVIKRIMYGRCTFDSLRKKVLSLEKLRKFN